MGEFVAGGIGRRVYIFVTRRQGFPGEIRVHLDLRLMLVQASRVYRPDLQRFSDRRCRSPCDVPALCEKMVEARGDTRRRRADRGSSPCPRRPVWHPPRGTARACSPVWIPPMPTTGIATRAATARDLRQGDRADRRTGQPAGPAAEPRRPAGPPAPGAGAKARSVLMSDTASAPASCAAPRDGGDVGGVRRELDDQRLGVSAGGPRRARRRASPGRRRGPGRCARWGTTR